MLLDRCLGAVSERVLQVTTNTRMGNETLDTNKYPSISKITKYLRQTVSSNISRFHAITGCDTTSYFFRMGKIADLKKILKQSDSISFISELGKQTTVDDMTIERCMRFIQIVLYAGKNDDANADTRIRLYKK